MDGSGLIGSAEQTGTARSIPEGRTHSYVIHDGTAEGGPLITVTQGDIRAIQLAKSALYAGARLLMDEMGVDKVDRVVLAGAFGAHISPKHAMVLGMIPGRAARKVTSCRQRRGDRRAHRALQSVAARREIERRWARSPRSRRRSSRASGAFRGGQRDPAQDRPFPELKAIVTLPEVSFNTGGGEARRRRRG